MRLFNFLNSFGVTWDEEAQRNYAEMLWSWYKTLGVDARCQTHSNLYKYGGFAELFHEAVFRISQYFNLGLDEYQARHLATLFFGVFGIYATFKLASFVGGRLSGFAAAIFLVLTPTYFGHSFFNSKDVPFAAMTSYFVFCAVRWMGEKNKRNLITLGISLGLALGIRIGGIILFFCLAFLVLAPCLRSFKTLKSNLISLSFIFSIAWFVMILFWPYAQVSPFRHPFLVLKEMSTFDWGGTILLNGEYLAAQSKPRSYVLSYLFVVIPESILMLSFVLPLFFGLNIKTLTLFALIILPILSVSIKGSVLYDGIRQFMFVMPLIAALAGVYFTKLMQSRFKVLAILVFISSLHTAYEIKQLWPYTQIYFNPLFSGGFDRAATRFDTDYWGFSHQEGLESLSQYVKNTFGENKIASVSTCMNPFIAKYSIDKLSNLKLSQAHEKSEYRLISFKGLRPCEDYNGETLLSVKRHDFELLRIVKQDTHGPH